jgi:hypothetical protein
MWGQRGFWEMLMYMLHRRFQVAHMNLNRTTHGITPQKTVLFIVTAVRAMNTSNTHLAVL